VPQAVSELGAPLALNTYASANELSFAAANALKLALQHRT
jgi:hypothetical protein